MSDKQFTVTISLGQLVRMHMALMERIDGCRKLVAEATDKGSIEYWKNELEEAKRLVKFLPKV
jgi:hypothetical protein